MPRFIFPEVLSIIILYSLSDTKHIIIIIRILNWLVALSSKVTIIQLNIVCVYLQLIYEWKNKTKQWFPSINQFVLLLQYYCLFSIMVIVQECPKVC